MCMVDVSSAVSDADTGAVAVAGSDTGARDSVGAVAGVSDACATGFGSESDAAGDGDKGIVTPEVFLSAAPVPLRPVRTKPYPVRTRERRVCYKSRWGWGTTRLTPRATGAAIFLSRRMHGFSFCSELTDDVLEFLKCLAPPRLLSNAKLMMKTNGDVRDAEENMTATRELLAFHWTDAFDHRARSKRGMALLVQPDTRQSLVDVECSRDFFIMSYGL